MTRSVCGGVRSSTLDSLGMKYHKKNENMKIFTKTLFFLKKNPMTFFKNMFFPKIMIFLQKVTFFIDFLIEKVTFWRKNHDFRKFLVFEKCHHIFFKKKTCFQCFLDFFFTISRDQPLKVSMRNSCYITTGHDFRAGPP